MNNTNITTLENRLPDCDWRILRHYMESIDNGAFVTKLNDFVEEHKAATRVSLQLHVYDLIENMADDLVNDDSVELVAHQKFLKDFAHSVVATPDEEIESNG